MTILERLRAATGPDRELDVSIRAFEVGATAEWQEHLKAYAFHRDGSWVSIEPITPVTASVDAALALVERMLPGWTIGGMRQGDNKQWTVELREGHATSYDRVIIEPRHWNGTTLPLAILTALFEALEAKEKNK